MSEFKTVRVGDRVFMVDGKRRLAYLDLKTRKVKTYPAYKVAMTPTEIKKRLKAS